MELFTNAIKVNDLDILIKIQKVFILHETRTRNLKNAQELLDSQLLKA